MKVGSHWIEDGDFVVFDKDNHGKIGHCLLKVHLYAPSVRRWCVEDKAAFVECLAALMLHDPHPTEDDAAPPFVVVAEAMSDLAKNAPSKKRKGGK